MRILKFFVILGGIALIAGYAVLLQRFLGQQPVATSAAPVAVSVSQLDIAAGGRVTALSPHGEGSALLVEGAGGQELLLVDKKGNLLKRLPLRPLPPAVPTP